MTAAAWVALAITIACPSAIIAAVIVGTQRAYRRAPKHPAPRKD